MAVFAKRQTALFPRWKGSKDLPKVDGAYLKMRIFHASANKVTIQFYTERQALLSQTQPGTRRASWSEILQVPASASTNAWPGLHRRHGCSSLSDDKLVQVMFLTRKLSLWPLPPSYARRPKRTASESAHRWLRKLERVLDIVTQRGVTEGSKAAKRCILRKCPTRHWPILLG